jgi:hypothetical protein
MSERALGGISSDQLINEQSFTVEYDPDSSCPGLDRIHERKIETPPLQISSHVSNTFETCCVECGLVGPN